MSAYKVENKILAVSASPRRGGNSDTVMKYFCDGAASCGVSVLTLYLSDIDLHSCVGCEACRKAKICTRFSDGLSPAYEHIKAAKGLFLITPVYNYNLTAWMKMFIDRLYCFYDFEEPRPGPWSSRLAGSGRKAVAAAVCEQEEVKDMGVVFPAMTEPLKALGYEIFTELPIMGVFAKGKVLEQEDVLKRACGLGRDFAQSLSR